MFPFNVINWVKILLLSGLMSICLGAIFIGIRWRYWDSTWDPVFEQDNIGDRLGFHYVFMTVGVWPTVLSLVTDEWRNKRAITRDVQDRLYSKVAYIFTKVEKITFHEATSRTTFFIRFLQTLYSLPACGGIFLAYTIPGYLLAGIHYAEARKLDIFYLFIGETCR